MRLLYRYSYLFLYFLIVLTAARTQSFNENSRGTGGVAT
jgi:hypothetical protein